MSKKNSGTFKIIAPGLAAVPDYEYDSNTNGTFTNNVYSLLPNLISCYNGPGIYDCALNEPSSSGVFQLDFIMGALPAPATTQIIAASYDSSLTSIPYISFSVNSLGEISVAVMDSAATLVASGSFSKQYKAGERVVISLQFNSLLPFVDGTYVQASANKESPVWAIPPAASWTSFKPNKVSLSGWTVAPVDAFSGKIIALQTGRL